MSKKEGMETIISVDNLKCGGCANTIKNSIKKVAGVNGVAVDVDTSAVSILHEVGVSKQKLLKRLASLGYPELGTSSDLQKVKSYVSCAVGKMHSIQ